MQFGSVKPDTGQFEDLPRMFVIVIAIAAPVINNGSIEVQPHLFNDAFDSGARAFQFLFQHRTRYGVASRSNSPVQRIDTM